MTNRYPGDSAFRSALDREDLVQQPVLPMFGHPYDNALKLHVTHLHNCPVVEVLGGLGWPLTTLLFLPFGLGARLCDPFRLGVSPRWPSRLTPLGSNKSHIPLSRITSGSYLAAPAAGRGWRWLRKLPASQGSRPVCRNGTCRLYIRM